nr:three-finger toxin [Helicops leopardinus]
MKTLLLSLVVVAFVYLDSGHTIICHSCNKKICLDHEICPDEPACYIKVSGGEVTKGCTTNCTLPAAGEKIKYCTKNRCNQFF